MNSEKVAISLPKDLLDTVDGLRTESGESRSRWIQRAIRTALHKHRHRERVSAYVRGYQKHEEDKEEESLAMLGFQVLAEEPWSLDGARSGGPTYPNQQGDGL